MLALQAIASKEQQQGSARHYIHSLRTHISTEFVIQYISDDTSMRDVPPPSQELALRKYLFNRRRIQAKEANLMNQLPQDIKMQVVQCQVEGLSGHRF